MANDYTTSTDAFGDMSEGSYSSSDYPQMATFVSAASRLIDRELGMWDGFFYPTTDSVIFYFDGSGDREQFIDAFVVITEVAVSEQGGLQSSDYTVWASSDYIEYPYNHTAKGKPITKLLADMWNQSTNTTFYRYPRSVRVTGQPGYSLTPPDTIALATRIQAVRWFMRAKQGYQDTGANVNLGAMTFTTKLELDPDVKQMLHSFKLELERND